MTIRGLFSFENDYLEIFFTSKNPLYYQVKKPSHVQWRAIMACHSFSFISRFKLAMPLKSVVNLQSFVPSKCISTTNTKFWKQKCRD